MSVLWITNAHIIDPASKRDEKGSLFVRNGILVASLSAAEKKSSKKIDAKGLIACPGLVDIHVHFREPGQGHKETIGTGSRAAAAGGFTTVVCMPNTSPPADNTGTIQFIKDAIERDAVIKVLPTGCITVGMKGQALAPIGSLKRAGVVAITDDGDCVQSNEVMRRAAEYAKMFNLPLMDHCQDSSMTQGSVMNEGIMSTRLGLRGWPNAAEDLIVSRNLILSKYTGAHIHLQHISSAYSVELIRLHKKEKIKVTSEATPHHIALTDEALLSYDTALKMNPPLRTETDRKAIIEGLRDGTIDCISTDHAPHTDYEKDREFDYAPNGILGLETALAVCLDILVKKNKFSLSKVIGLMTHKPAAILGLNAGTLAVGAPADICLFDPTEKWTYDATKGFSKSVNSPWHNSSFVGKIKMTIVDGKVVYSSGKILA
jgi:dihydroorotase